MSIDLVEQGKLLVTSADTTGARLRLFGGVAVWLLVHDQAVPRASPGDIDCVGLSRDLHTLLATFSSMGYEEDVEIRRLFGQRRRTFVHRATNVKVDLCLDYLEFSARIDTRRALKHPVKSRPFTLPVSELLLSKLQPKELADKDVADVINLLTAFKPGRKETDTEFCLKRFVKPCSRDWGLCQLVSDNLSVVKSVITRLEPLVDCDVLGRIDLLIGHLRHSHKSLQWWVRSLFGRRLQYWNEVDVP